MSYSGRRGPNVSQYIASLNEIPNPQDLQNAAQDNLSFEDDLAMFTDIHFEATDFDLGQDTDFNSLDYDARGEQTTWPDNADAKPSLSMPGDFSFQDFSGFNAQTFANDSLIQGPPLQPNRTIYPAPSSAGSPTAAVLSSNKTGEKRKAGVISESQSPADLDDGARVAAEEDKRRRNTAASARFRVKKKQREQALERSAKEMSDKVAALEGKINQLETENKWLKGLITERNESKEDIAALWKKFQETSERRGSERKDGVGTRA